MLDRITPLILTYNERENIARTLSQLTWAAEIVVIDSGSTDGTLEILQSYRQVRTIHREFDTFAEQCNFGLRQATSEWVLSLDADHFVTEDLVAEIAQLSPDFDVSGYRVRFRYCIDGRPLRASLYPPRISLYRRNRALYTDHGHGHHVRVSGEVRDLSAPMLHDDRKSLARWLRNQSEYMRIEADLLQDSSMTALNWADRLRKLVVIAPFAVLFHTLFVRRLLLDGRLGLHYALQRMLAETILSLRLIEQQLRKERP